MEKTRFTMSFPNPQEKVLLRQLAKMDGYVSLAAYVRMLIRKAAKKHHILFGSNDQSEITRLSKAGINRDGGGVP